MKKQTGVAWMQAKLSRHRRAAQVSAFSQPAAPPVSHARHPQNNPPPTALSQQTQPPAIIQPTQPMTESLFLTADQTAITKAAAQAGPYFAARLAEMLAAPSLDDLLTLDFVHSGRAVKIMAVKISPYLNGAAAVLPLRRLVMVNAESGNESHAAKLTTAARRAMENRDPMAAAREIRELGSPVGFETVVTGV